MNAAEAPGDPVDSLRQSRHEPNRLRGGGSIRPSPLLHFFGRGADPVIVVKHIRAERFYAEKEASYPLSASIQ